MRAHLRTYALRLGLAVSLLVGGAVLGTSTARHGAAASWGAHLMETTIVVDLGF